MSRDLIIILSSIGVINSLILSIFVFFFPIGNRTSNRILAFLILLLSLKIGKSVLIYVYNIPIDIVVIGILAFYCIGPCVYVFIQSYKPDFTARKLAFSLLHFVFPVVNVAFILRYFFRTQSILWDYSFIFLLVFYLIYWVLSFRIYNYLVKSTSLKNNDIDKLVIKSVLIGTFVVWLSYLLYSIFSENLHNLLGPTVYSLVLYFSIFFIYRYSLFYRQSKKIEKYSDQSLSVEERDMYLKKILEKFENEKLYLSPDLTLTQLSSVLSIRYQTLSRIINEHYKMNFSEFLNSYRINHCCNLMRLDKYSDEKIAALAFESGFNSISAFNAAFKKFTKHSPSEYRKIISKKSS
ncbi:helix-turn-helix domain-containing protein [Tenuifilum osseticum]|uniref:helix-turn-helix domain-containing protein n=1 Tax=Tenuifilum osseticum TaxID=3374723 RepID=UPI0034E5B661